MARGRPESPAHKAPPARALSLPARVLESWSNWNQTIKRVTLAGIVVVAVTILAAYLVAPSPDVRVVLPYDVFKVQLKNHNVASLTTVGTRIEGVTCSSVTEPGTARAATLFATTSPAYGDPELEALVEASPGCNGRGVSVNAQRVAFRWDFIPSATPLSTFSAVLAGFVIIAVATILSFPIEGKIPPHIPLQPLLTAFLTLVVSAFLFAVMTGIPPGGGDLLLPLAQGYAISWLLVFGILQTVVGIAWLMKHFDMEASALRAARWVVHVGVLVLGIAIAGAITQALYVLYPDRVIEDGAAWAFVSIVPLLAVPIGVRLNKGGSEKLLSELTLPALGLVVAGLIGCTLLLGISEEQARDGYKVVFSLMVAAQMVLAVTVVLYEAGLPIITKRAA
jgi:hypothetical protein